VQHLSKQSNPLLWNHFHSVATNHYVFHETSKSIKDYISDASRIMSLSSNQLMVLVETQLPSAPSSHSKRPTSSAGDLLTMAAETDLDQVLKEQLLSLFAAPALSRTGTSDIKCSFN
jgi:hypothetical protein